MMQHEMINTMKEYALTKVQHWWRSTSENVPNAAVCFLISTLKLRSQKSLWTI